MSIIQMSSYPLSPDKHEIRIVVSAKMKRNLESMAVYHGITLQDILDQVLLDTLDGFDADDYPQGHELPFQRSLNDD